MPHSNKKWYQKKWIWVVTAIGVFYIVAQAGNSGSQGVSAQPQTYTPQAVSQSAQNAVSPATPVTPTTSAVPLSNDNYYVNTAGNTVHSPAYSETGAVPAGASARCRDGTYSFSQSRRGTCSHHGGVAQWL